MSRSTFHFRFVWSVLVLSMVFFAGIPFTSKAINNRVQVSAYPNQDKIAQARDKEHPLRRRTLPREAGAGRRTWVRAYGGPYSGGARDLRLTRDGGFIIASSIPDPYGMAGGGWLIKAFDTGEIEWQRSYTYPDRSGIIFCSAQQTRDGGYVAAGLSSALSIGYSDVVVLKLSSRGEIEWQSAYEGIDCSGINVVSILQASEGGYVVAGSGFNTPSGSLDYWVLKLNPIGAVEWQRVYGGAGDDQASSIAQTADGGYILAGYSSSFADDYRDIWLLKLTTSGSIEWQRTYRNPGQDRTVERTEQVQQTSDGGYIVAGYSYSFRTVGANIRVLKLFPNGEIEWQRLYRGKGWDYALSAEQTEDGGYVVAGRTTLISSPHSLPRDEDRDHDLLILKLDARGGIDWQRTYGATGCDEATSIHQTDDGGYVVGVHSYSSLGRGPSDILVLRIDSLGYIERLPEFIGTISAETRDTQVAARNTFIKSIKTKPDIWMPGLESRETNEPSDLLFGPPVKATGETVMNRSLSQAEYMHRLSWEENLNNDDLRIVGYRIYRRDGQGQLLAELDARSFHYLVRSIWPDLIYTYAVAGVAEEGDEGLPAIIKISR